MNQLNTEQGERHAPRDSTHEASASEPRATPLAPFVSIANRQNVVICQGLHRLERLPKLQRDSLSSKTGPRNSTATLLKSLGVTAATYQRWSLEGNSIIIWKTVRTGAPWGACGGHTLICPNLSPDGCRWCCVRIKGKVCEVPRSGPAGTRRPNYAGPTHTLI